LEVVDAVKSVVAIENVRAAIDQTAQMASDTMMAHALALRLRQCTPCRVGLRKHTTVRREYL